MVDIQSVAAEILARKKRKKPPGKNIMACPIPQGNDKYGKTNEKWKKGKVKKAKDWEVIGQGGEEKGLMRAHVWHDFCRERWGWNESFVGWSGVEMKSAWTGESCHCASL